MTKSLFYRNSLLIRGTFCGLVIVNSRYQNYLNEQLVKWVWSFKQHQKWSPTCYLPFKMWKTWKITKKSGLSAFKWYNCAVNYFRSWTSRGKVVCVCFEDNCEKHFKPVHIFLFYNVLVLLLNWRKYALFQTIVFGCTCWKYPVKNSVARFKVYENVFCKVKVKMYIKWQKNCNLTIYFNTPIHSYALFQLVAPDCHGCT